MYILDLISRESPIDKKVFITLGCVSAFANALILAIINVSAFYVADNYGKGSTLYYLALFLVVVLIFGMTQRRLLLKATLHVENAIDKLRKALTNKICQCELMALEQIGKERINTVMTNELQTISKSAQLFVVVIQSSALVFFSAIYVAYLSLSAFLIIAGSISIGAIIHLKRSKEINRQLALAFEGENAVIKKLGDFLFGFKELKLSRTREHELKQAFAEDSNHVTAARREIQTLFANDFVSTQLTFYLAIGSILFLAPSISQIDPAMVIQITTATLFLIGPISNAIGGLPTLASANAAAFNVLELEKALSASTVAPSEGPVLTNFEQIRFKGLHFVHRHRPDERGFEVGPVNLTVKKGQTIFITGGNGSGKTTLIRLMMGLYRGVGGCIEVDGRVVQDERLDAYRNLFTAVFSDFHLFETLYGLAEHDPEEAQQWLKFLEMDHKVLLVNGQFSTIDLSTGQRKRLALLSSILEHRPIYVFDEWAADQDPHFREKFYHEVLPKLKQKGQTVLAITHDDKYFDMADVRLKVADGQVFEQ